MSHSAPRAALVAAVLTLSATAPWGAASGRRAEAEEPPAARAAGMVKTNPMDGAEMVWVPEGQFRMGTPEVQALVLGEEQPVHLVRIGHGFWIYKTPVTNAQYRRFLEANPQHRKPAFWSMPENNAPAQPVVGVDWKDANDYCVWAHAELPTEAQWEYAARGPKSTFYPWGNAEPTPKLAVYNRQKAAPVGSCPNGKSWCGALDMVGNVSQWCADWFGDNYYKKSPAIDPPGPSKPAELRQRNIRCSPFGMGEINLRASFRARGMDDDRNDDLGFRPMQADASGS